MGAGAQAAGEAEDLHRLRRWASSRSTGSLTSLASAKPPLGSGAFQLRPYSVRSTIASSSRPTFSTPPKVSCGSVIVPRASIGRECALDRQLAVDDQRAVLGAHERRGEGDVRVTLGVEEVRRLQVGGQVLVLDGDRVGADAALEAQRAVLGGGQRRVVVLEAAAEGRDDHVLDGEADGASGRCRRSRWCRRDGGGGGDGGHWMVLLSGSVSGPWSACWRHCSTLIGPRSSCYHDLHMTSCPPPARRSAPRARRRRARTAARCSRRRSELFARCGPANVTMDAVAAEAGVGKGTLFRRFGDRAGLARAVHPEHETTLQDAMIRGAAAARPGRAAAGAPDRLRRAPTSRSSTATATCCCAAEGSHGAHPGSSAPYAFYRTHVAVLLRAGRPGRPRATTSPTSSSPRWRRHRLQLPPRASARLSLAERARGRSRGPRAPGS